ncbi:MAG: low temperature requirement protein A [Actinomycetota bacterium]|nr:low temperature requirement protein A [Actinomycetota bacterium]
MGVRFGEPSRPDQTADGPAGARRHERWFVPPRLQTVAEEAEPRHASWLELFFDLVFVVAITELSRELVADHSAGGFLRFAALFFPVFVAWQGYMAYADRFDTDDLLFRAAYFAAMLAIAAMAVLIGDVADGRHSAQFAIAYVCLRSFMLVLYLRAWRAVPEARPLVRFYGIGYATGAALWLISLALPTPSRYALWVVAQVLELSLPPLTTRIHRRVRTSASHLPERWALFTLIVLGESVVAVAVGTAGTHWRPDSVAAAVLGFIAVAAIWWLYFDRQANVVLHGSTMSVVVYSYAHIPLLMGLAALSAGLRLVIDRAGQGHLGAGAAAALLGGAVLYMVALVGTRSVTLGGRRRVGVSLKLGAAAILIGILAAQGALPPLAVAAGLAGVLVAVVFLERTLIQPSPPAS